VAQITNVTSESLQAKIRQLLPSQQGFGEDLQASNVILPVIDLTETASGSSVRQDLQTAFDHSVTSFNIQNATDTTILTGNTGFWRVTYTFTGRTANSTAIDCRLSISDGTTTKIIAQMEALSGSVGAYNSTNTIVVYLRAGDDLLGSAIGSTAVFTSGSVRQIADINGNLVNPNGFTPQ